MTSCAHREYNLPQLHSLCEADISLSSSQLNSSNIYFLKHKKEKETTTITKDPVVSLRNLELFESSLQVKVIITPLINFCGVAIPVQDVSKVLPPHTYWHVSLNVQPSLSANPTQVGNSFQSSFKLNAWLHHQRNFGLVMSVFSQTVSYERC